MKKGRRSVRLLAAALSAGLVASCAPGLAPGFVPEFIDAIQPVRYQPVGSGEDAVKLAVYESGRGKPLILVHE